MCRACIFIQRRKNLHMLSIIACLKRLKQELPENLGKFSRKEILLATLRLIIHHTKILEGCIKSLNVISYVILENIFKCQEISRDYALYDIYTLCVIIKSLYCM